MKFYRIVLASILFLFCIGGVCATDTNNTDPLNTDESDLLEGNVNIENSEDCDECYINASDFTLNYGTYSTYPVQVYDYKGNPINEGLVYVTIVEDDDMPLCTWGEVINGKADVMVRPCCNIGTHKATIIYDNYNDDYDDSDEYDNYDNCKTTGDYVKNRMIMSYNKTTVNFNVVKTNAHIVKYQTTAYYKSNDWFMFHAVSKDDKVVGVKFKVDVYTGKKYKTYYIESGTGCALLSADKVTIGSHKAVISVCDPNVKAKPITTTLTLKKAKTKVHAPKVSNFYKSKKYFKVTVKNTLTGKPIKDLKLKLTVYTGKKHKNYYVKTNSKGVAKLSTKYLQIGSHKVLINSANSKYSVKSKSSIIIKKKVIKSTIVKIKSSDYPYSKSIGGNDCIYGSYHPHFSPQHDCSRGTHIDLCGVDSMEPYSHLLVKAKIYFKNKKGKIITKTCKSDGYSISKIAPKGYIPYKAKVYYYHA